MMRSLRSEYGDNVTLSPRERFPRRRCPADIAGLTMEETIEFEALDALPPFDDSGNIAWEGDKSWILCSPF
jgi:hypothetical protein